MKMSPKNKTKQKNNKNIHIINKKERKIPNVLNNVCKSIVSLIYKILEMWL